MRKMSGEMKTCGVKQYKCGVKMSGEMIKCGVKV